VRDDGAVVYLNGVEVFRSNMPTGTITNTTRASGAVNGNAERQWFTGTINPALLVAGNNVIAVEVHQNDPTSSDVSFNFELSGTTSGGGTTVQPPATPGTLTAVAASPTQVNLAWGDLSSNETGFKVERSPDGTNGWAQIGTVNAGVTTYQDTTAAASTTYFYRVRAYNTAGDSGYTNVASATTPAASQTTAVTFISTGSSWKYLDNGTDQGTAWRATAFDDSTWKSGNAELGYGDGDETTIVSFGPNAAAKYITTYFRKSFTVADPRPSAR
jgi:hypothetical protein